MFVYIHLFRDCLLITILTKHPLTAQETALTPLPFDLNHSSGVWHFFDDILTFFGWEELRDLDIDQSVESVSALRVDSLRWQPNSC